MPFQYFENPLKRGSCRKRRAQGAADLKQRTEVSS